MGIAGLTRIKIEGSRENPISPVLLSRTTPFAQLNKSHCLTVSRLT